MYGYDYKEAVKDDVRKYIEENYTREELRAELSARGLEKIFEYGCRAQLWQFLRAKPETLARYAINAYCNREKRVKMLARSGATHSGAFATAWGELWEIATYLQKCGKLETAFAEAKREEGKK